MKITNLTVQNIKGVRQIEIHADAVVNELAGKNGAGKSSVLDSILYALGGKRGIDDMPVREGEEKAEIVLETDDLVVTRRFKGDTTSLVVRGKDGGRYGQRRLDQLFSGFTFDPLAFTRLSAAEQINHVKHLAGKEFTRALGEIEGKIIEAFEKRKDLNAQLKRFGVPDPVEKVEPVNVDDLMQELEEAEEFNEAQADRKLDIGRQAARTIGYQDTVHDLETELVEIQRKLVLAREMLAESEAQAAKLEKPEPLIDTSELKERIRAASDQNAAGYVYEQYLKRVQERRELVADVEAATDTLDDLRGKRLDMMAGGNFPVEGIAFVNDALVVNNIPFAQMSSSERIRVSAQIGMAAKSELKIMFVRDGSLLDAESFAELTKIAESRKYQLWVETVGDGHSGDAIILEEGSVKG